MPKYLTVQEVAKRLGMGERRVYRWAERGKIPGVKMIDFGGRRQRVFLFSEREIKKFEQSS
jgi:excisionase family DNA binding protein